MTHIDSDEFFSYDMDGDVVDRRNKVIRRLERQIGMMCKDADYEAHLRSLNPGLMDAWEKYQILLRLAKNE